MYCDAQQWQHIRRRIMAKGTPKKQVSRETGISRQTINRMLAHEYPPGYQPRPRRYPKLGPYIHTIDRILHNTILFSTKADLTIRDIVGHLRREEGFAGSYDSVRNYIRQRSCDNEIAWERAYELIIRLPKSRALDFVRLLSRGNPPPFPSAQLQSFLREVTGPRKTSIRPNRGRKRRADFEWMRQVLQKEINDDTLHRELDSIPDLSVLLQHLHNGRLLDRNRAMAALASHREIPSQTICDFLGVGKAFVRRCRNKLNSSGADVMFAPQTRNVSDSRSSLRAPAGSFPSATDASISFAACRACSGVNSRLPKYMRRFATRRPPAPGRYSMNQLMEPLRATRTPKPFRSVS